MRITDQQAAIQAADQQNEVGALRAVLAASKAHLGAINHKREAVHQLRTASRKGTDLVLVFKADAAVKQATANVDRAEAYLKDAISRAEAKR